MNVAPGRCLFAISLVLGVVGSYACASGHTESVPSDPLGVYSAVLRQHVAPGAIVAARTVAPVLAGTPFPKDLPAGLLVAFTRATSGAQVTLVAGQELPSGITTAPELALSDRAAFERMFRGANGLVTFSQVGIDQAAGAALVYFSHATGSVNGGGYLCLLRWRHGAWHIEKLVPLWVS